MIPTTWRGLVIAITFGILKWTPRGSRQRNPILASGKILAQIGLVGID
jgi:hypothetical protein